MAKFSVLKLDQIDIKARENFLQPGKKETTMDQPNRLLMS